MIPLDKLRAVKIVYTHANCPDGVASALIVKDALPDVRVTFVKYGTDEHRRIVVEPGVLFCDFSPYLPADEPARSNLARYWRDVGVIVLDHHSRDVVEPYGELGVFGENERLECGAMLAFKHVWLPLHGFKSSNIADHVFNFAELVAVRDTWKRDDPRFQAALGQGEAFLFWGDKAHLAAFLNGDEETIALGEHLLAKKLAAARTAIAESYRFTSARGTRVLVFQGVSATSDAAELLEQQFDEHPHIPPSQPDIVVGFHYRHETCSSCGGGGDNDPSGEHGLDPACPHCRGLGGRLQLQFSTRSHAGFDCQAFARAHGGNGHRAAAGFTVEVSPEVGGNPYAVFRELLNEWEEGQ